MLHSIEYKNKIYYNPLFLGIARMFFPLIIKCYTITFLGVNGEIPKKMPMLIACHHEEKVDPFIVDMVLNRRLFWIADTSHNISLADTKIRKYLMRRMGVIPIDKRNPKRNKHLFGYIHYLFNEGESIVFFPEGGIRSERNNEKFGKFKTGIIRCVLEYEKKYKKKIPIIPIGLKYDRLEGTKLCYVNIGKLFYINSLSDSERLFNSIKELSS